jgi:hypothetical protein
VSSLDHTEAPMMYMAFFLLLCRFCQSGEVEELSAILKQHGLEEHVAIFQSQEVDYETFLTLSDDDLLNQIGRPTLCLFEGVTTAFTWPC